MAVLLARGITSVPEAEIKEHELRLYLGRPIYVCNPMYFRSNAVVLLHINTKYLDVLLLNMQRAHFGRL